MAWYDEAVFYHIYPLGLTGAPKQNDYQLTEHRLNDLIPWIAHLKKIGVTGLYIGPLFESVGHGYETTDYKKVDSRLGDNKDLTNFVKECHKEGIRVILDGVFNHTGRDFFAFKDIKENRENSRYRDWYCNVNFGGNNEYNDGFCYENWGGYNLLVKLNQRNPEVCNYICDVIRFWVDTFDIDGIRLDAADVLDFDFMRALRNVANEVKPDFWLMGEVIHGDYTRWVNEGTLHSVTNYVLHKGLFSGHNDHNFFEIAHTVNRLNDMSGSNGLKLYNFVDNHDVERIFTKLNNKAHFAPVHILMYTLPGVPSIYYGSEFAIEGRKEKSSDDSLRPALNLADFKDSYTDNPYTSLIVSLGAIRHAASKAFSYGSYKQLYLTNRQYAYARACDGEVAIVIVNNDDNDATVTVSAEGQSHFYGALSGNEYTECNGQITVNVPSNYGEILLLNKLDGKVVKTTPVKTTPAKSKKVAKSDISDEKATPIKEEKVTDAIKPDTKASDKKSSSEKSSCEKSCKNTKKDTPKVVSVPVNKSYEEMTVEELQAAILEKMASNGPVTDDMKKTVADNVWHDSLVNWVKSFR